jgi:MFS family permease
MSKTKWVVVLTAIGSLMAATDTVVVSTTLSTIRIDLHAPWTATFLTVAPIAGALVDKIGERPLMVTGLSLQAAGMAWLALVAEPGMAAVGAIVGLALPGRRGATAPAPTLIPAIERAG